MKTVFRLVSFSEYYIVVTKELDRRSIPDQIVIEDHILGLILDHDLISDHFFSDLDLKVIGDYRSLTFGKIDDFSKIFLAK